MDTFLRTLTKALALCLGLSAATLAAQSSDTVVIGPPVAVGPSYDLIENGEGPSTPAGFTDGGAPVWGYSTSPAPLRGAGSLEMGTGDTTTYSIAGSTVYTLAFELILTDWSPAANSNCVQFIDSGSVARMELSMRTNSNIRVIVNAATVFTDTAVRSDGDRIWVKIHLERIGDGSDVVQVYIQTSGTWGSPVYSSTTATLAASLDRFRLSGIPDTAHALFDTIRGDNAIDIGNLP